MRAAKGVPSAGTLSVGLAAAAACAALLAGGRGGTAAGLTPEVPQGLRADWRSNKPLTHVAAWAAPARHNRSTGPTGPIADDRT